MKVIAQMAYMTSTRIMRGIGPDVNTVIVLSR